MGQKQRLVLCCGLAILGFVVCGRDAAALTIDATDQGWYSSVGDHMDWNRNYIAGFSQGSARQYRNFFVFDTSGLARSVASGTLRLYTWTVFLQANPPTNYETWVAYDVTTPTASLLAGGTGLVPTFNDLGSGTVYGSRDFYSTDSNTFVEIPLNAAAVSAINAATDYFAIGGAITTLDQAYYNEYVYGHSDYQKGGVQLLVDYVPEPATVCLLGVGLLGLLGAHLRKRKQ